MVAEVGHHIAYVYGEPWILLRRTFENLRSYVYAMIWSDFVVRESRAERKEAAEEASAKEKLRALVV